MSLPVVQYAVSPAADVIVRGCYYCCLLVTNTFPVVVITCDSFYSFYICPTVAAIMLLLTADTERLLILIL